MAERGPRAGRWGCCSGRLLLIVAVVLVGVWLGRTALDEMDRASHTEVIGGLRIIGPIHARPDGSIVFAERDDAGGRVVAFDPATRSRTTLLDGLIAPVAGAVARDGTVCAIVQLSGATKATAVQCSSGLGVDLARTKAGEFDDPADLADLVADRSGGWFVADAGRGTIFRVDASGRVEIVVSFANYPTLRARPMSLDRAGDVLYAATGEGGYARLSTSARGLTHQAGGSYVGGYTSAVSGTLLYPIVIVREFGVPFVTYPVMADAERPHLVDRLTQPTGLAILPDGRIAVVDGLNLLIVRPRSPLVLASAEP